MVEKVVIVVGLSHFGCGYGVWVWVRPILIAESEGTRKISGEGTSVHAKISSKFVHVEHTSLTPRLLLLSCTTKHITPNDQPIQWHQRQQQRAVSGIQEALRTLATGIVRMRLEWLHFLRGKKTDNTFSTEGAKPSAKASAAAKATLRGVSISIP